MSILTLLVAEAFGGDDFLAKSDDMEKAPCVILLSKPVDCESNALCIEVVNITRDKGIVPSIPGVCGPGTMEIADIDGVIHMILDPDRSTSRHPIGLPILAPAGSAYPSRGWITAARPVFDIQGVAYGGTWRHLFDFALKPGILVGFYDDDPSLDIGDHMWLGNCRLQKDIEVGHNKLIMFGDDCAGAELAKSRR